MVYSEVKDAGNCLAADLNTAAVFHLVRVCEIGIRSLAKHLKVKIKNVPLDYARWEQVLNALDKKIAALKQTSKGKKKTEVLAFYQGIVAELSAFKDIWRNEVMHCRCSYNEHQAQHALERVRGFMQRLSTKLTEKGV